ncbi:MAG: TraR/DksA family transcriptional regulator, partial [Candidatus Kapaibacteriota bacterium]
TKVEEKKSTTIVKTTNEDTKTKARKSKTESEEVVVKVAKKTPRLTEDERKKYEQQLEEEKAAEKAKKTQPKPQVRYSDEDLEIFRKRILEVKKEALEELNMLRERLEDLNAYDLAEEGSIYSMHMAEQGSEIFEKEKVYAQIQRINEYIKKLDEALKRIDDKTYGICRVCGILIAKERLLAVPITTLSASYKIHKKCPEDGIDRIEPVK